MGVGVMLLRVLEVDVKGKAVPITFDPPLEVDMPVGSMIEIRTSETGFVLTFPDGQVVPVEVRNGKRDSDD